MTTNDQIRDALADVWVMSLDADPATWHESPWAHIVFLIGQKIGEIDPRLIASESTARMAMAEIPEEVTP